jgi:hypothetical protein
MQVESLEQPSTASGPHDHIRRLVHEACEPVAQFWPMKRFVHHNPIHGLEHLPFDRAVRHARRLLGGSGYLLPREYRQFYDSGRIAAESVTQALERVGPSDPGAPAIRAANRRITAAEVWRAQLIVGCEPLEPALLHWTLNSGSALTRLQGDLPRESKRRLRERLTSADGANPRVAEEVYVRELWASAVLAGEREQKTTAAESTDSGSGWQEAAPTAPAGVEQDRRVDLPADRTMGDWVEVLAGTPIVEPINTQLTKWVAAFVDEGMAGWAMPGRQRGLYRTWRELAPRDRSGRFLGIPDFAAKIRALPDAPEDAIALALRRLAVPAERWVEYMSRSLAQLPGWAGLIRWLGENPAYPGQIGHPADAAQYLAIRLFYEAELVDALCHRTWHIPGSVPALASFWEHRPEEYARLVAGSNDAHDRGARVLSEQAWPLFRLAQFLELMPGDIEALDGRAVRTLLGWLAAFPEDGHGPVWLEAYEDSYRRRLLDLLAVARAASTAAPAAGRPRAQVVLCIDVRSESFRRHIEAQGSYETFGYAGFFGVAMNHEAFDSDERFPLCPVLLTPKHAVDEVVRPDQAKSLQSYASGTRWRQLADHLFHDLKQHPVSSLMLVDALGLFFSASLAGKTLAPRLYESIGRTVRGWFRHAVGTRVMVDSAAANTGGSGPLGFSVAEQAGMVEGGLRAIGLTKHFGRFIVLCGHGSISDNNPYFGALHCGACGGKHGDANARAFAMMANHPEVRAVLTSHGLEVPDDTWFLAAKHITTSDRVELYDLEDVPVSHRRDLEALRNDLERAGAAQALERCRRIPRAAHGDSPQRAYRHAGARTVDWANTRPEWGLSGNAAFIIGRRSVTKAVNLQGRAFLHSYNADHDPEGTILERIMTAPLIVGQWINMEHYFSAVDPWFWGSGSKVIHNVVSGVGVMAGSQSDLQTGLPLQTVNNGALHHHEPMRLLAVIEAPFQTISSVIGRHGLLQQLFHNGWLNLVAIDPATLASARYHHDGAWESLASPQAAPGPSAVQPSSLS